MQIRVRFPAAAKLRICLLLIVTISIFGDTIRAAPPAWWTDDQKGTRIIASTASPSNFSPLNVGQLKLVAKKAKVHLDIELAAIGGAGPAITTLVNGLVSDPASNYSPANLGQLKAIAKPFYERLIAVGYDTRQNLINHGAVGWMHTYSWNPSTPVAENYSSANIGQLKLTFSFSVLGFDVSQVDADDDDLLDIWEFTNGMSPFDATGANGANGDSDGDGLTNAEEQNLGANPNVKDNTAVELIVVGYVRP
jgi:hypothetical protein